MNLQQLISELQERNKIKFAKHLRRPDEAQALYEQTNQLTSDTAHAVALAVIGEMKTYVKKDMWPTADVQDLLDHLNTLEAKIKDV